MSFGLVFPEGAGKCGSVLGFGMWFFLILGVMSMYMFNYILLVLRMEVFILITVYELP